MDITGSILRTSGGIARQMANSLTSLTNTSAKLAAGRQANAVSQQAQNAQAVFNGGQAALANELNSQNLASQYQFNSGQASLANDFTGQMWDKAAAWNENMWQKTAEWNEKMLKRSMDFNASEAAKQRDWSKMMSDTQYQRAIADLKAAGLNPVLAATAGMTAGVGSGSAASIGGASVGAPSMSGASGAMASGGLLGADSASISNYSGQLEYMGGILGMLGQAFNGMSSAVGALTNLPFKGEDIAAIIKAILGETHGGDNPTILGVPINNPNDTSKDKPGTKYIPTNRAIFYGDHNRAY